MVNSKNTNIADEFFQTIETEKPQISSVRKPRSKDNLQSDDLIVALSNAYENKRAQQVFEWERVRRQNFQRAV